MTTLMFALALYGLATIAYQLMGLAIEAVSMIKKMNAAAETLLIPATHINRKKVTA